MSEELQNEEVLSEQVNEEEKVGNEQELTEELKEEEALPTQSTEAGLVQPAR